MVIVKFPEDKKIHVDCRYFLICLASFTILIFSFYQEYIVKIKPCPLCFWQRNVYLLIFLISPLGLISRFNSLVRRLLNVIFLLGMSLAFYHLLIQRGWISDHCVFTKTVQSMEDFVAMIEQSNVSCATIGWKLWGLPASIYNVTVLSLAFLILNFKNIKKASLCLIYLIRAKRQSPKKF